MSVDKQSPVPRSMNRQNRERSWQFLTSEVSTMSTDAQLNFFADIKDAAVHGWSF